MDRYMPGVPCWADVSQPDLQAAVTFYGDLFGWEIENVMPADADTPYYIARIDSKDAAAIASSSDGEAHWNTYVWVDSADEAAAKAKDAGGRVLMEPFDVGPSGRTAVLADTDGAAFNVWEAGEHRGAEVVNFNGSVNFNDLHAADIEKARAFYGAVFGWETLEMGPGQWIWMLPGYVDLLEQVNPGTKENFATFGVPNGFENAVARASLADGAPARWGITFGVDDVDAIAARAESLGATIDSPPTDAPWVKTTTITDPQGATFNANQFKPENR